MPLEVDNSGFLESFRQSKEVIFDLQKEGKLINQALKIDPTNVDLISQSFDNSQKSAEATREAIKNLREEQAKLQSEMKGDGTTEQQTLYRAITREITQLESKLSNTSDTLFKYNTDMAKVEQETNRLIQTNKAFGVSVDAVKNPMTALEQSYVINLQKLQDYEKQLKDVSRQYVDTGSNSEELLKKYQNLSEAKDRLTRDTKGLVGQIKDQGREIETTANNTSHFSSRISTLSLGIANFASNTVLGVLQRGISTVNNVMRESVQVSRNFDTALLLAQNTLRQNVPAIDSSTEALRRWARQLSENSLISDEAYLQGIKVAASYGYQEESIQALLRIAQDYAVWQYGMDVSTSQFQGVMENLSQAFNGNTISLQRQGFAFEDWQRDILNSGTEAERLAVLINTVGQELHGMNDALASTDYGQIVQARQEMELMQAEFGRTMGEIQGQFQRVMLPMVSDLLGRLLDTYEENKEQIDQIIHLIANGIGGALGIVIDFATIVLDIFTVINKNIATSDKMVGEMSVNLIETIMKAAASTSKLSDETDRLELARAKATMSEERFAEFLSESSKEKNNLNNHIQRGIELITTFAMVINPLTSWIAGLAIRNQIVAKSNESLSESLANLNNKYGDLDRRAVNTLQYMAHNLGEVREHVEHNVDEFGNLIEIIDGVPSDIGVNINITQTGIDLEDLQNQITETETVRTTTARRGAEQRQSLINDELAQLDRLRHFNQLTNEEELIALKELSKQYSLTREEQLTLDRRFFDVRNRAVNDFRLEYERGLREEFRQFSDTARDKFETERDFLASHRDLLRNRDVEERQISSDLVNFRVNLFNEEYIARVRFYDEATANALANHNREIEAHLERLKLIDEEAYANARANQQRREALELEREGIRQMQEERRQQERFDRQEEQLRRAMERAAETGDLTELERVRQEVERQRQEDSERERLRELDQSIRDIETLAREQVNAQREASQEIAEHVNQLRADTDLTLSISVENIEEQKRALQEDFDELMEHAEQLFEKNLSIAEEQAELMLKMALQSVEDLTDIFKRETPSLARQAEESMNTIGSKMNEALSRKFGEMIAIANNAVPDLGLALEAISLISNRAEDLLNRAIGTSMHMPAAFFDVDLNNIGVPRLSHFDNIIDDLLVNPSSGRAYNQPQIVNHNTYNYNYAMEYKDETLPHQLYMLNLEKEFRDRYGH